MMEPEQHRLEPSFVESGVFFFFLPGCKNSVTSLMELQLQSLLWQMSALHVK